MVFVFSWFICIQIKAFSMQLLHSRIEFGPLGLFKLNLNFMYGVSGIVFSKCDISHTYNHFIFKTNFILAYRCSLHIFNNINSVRLGTKIPAIKNNEQKCSRTIKLCVHNNRITPFLLNRNFAFFQQ